MRMLAQAFVCLLMKLGLKLEFDISIVLFKHDWLRVQFLWNI